MGVKQGLTKKLHKFQEGSHQGHPNKVQTSSLEALHPLFLDDWRLHQKTDWPQLLAFFKTVLLAAAEGCRLGSLVMDVRSYYHYWSGYCHYLSSYPNYTLWGLLCLVLNIFSRSLLYSVSCSSCLPTLPGFGAWKTQPLVALSPIPRSMPNVSANNNTG